MEIKLPGRLKNQPLEQFIQGGKANQYVEDIFDSVNKVVNDAFELALKQPLLGKQFIAMTDASFRNASYALSSEMIQTKKHIQSGKHTSP